MVHISSGNKVNSCYIKKYLDGCPHLFYFCPTDTVPEEQIFKVLLGPFSSDVALINVTFPSEVLSMSDCNMRGFNVLEHISPNSSSKVFTLEVPFTDRVVLQMVTFPLTLGNGILFFPS